MMVFLATAPSLPTDSSSSLLTGRGRVDRFDSYQTEVLRTSTCLGKGGRESGTAVSENLGGRFPSASPSRPPLGAVSLGLVRTEAKVEPTGERLERHECVLQPRTQRVSPFLEASEGNHWTSRCSAVGTERVSPLENERRVTFSNNTRSLSQVLGSVPLLVLLEVCLSFLNIPLKFFNFMSLISGCKYLKPAAACSVFHFLYCHVIN